MAGLKDRKHKEKRAALDKHMKEQRARLAKTCKFPDGKPGLQGCEQCGAMAGEACQKP